MTTFLLVISAPCSNGKDEGEEYVQCAGKQSKTSSKSTDLRSLNSDLKT